MTTYKLLYRNIKISRLYVCTKQCQYFSSSLRKNHSGICDPVSPFPVSCCREWGYNRLTHTLSHTHPLLPSPLSLLIYLFLLFVVCKTLRAVLLMFSSMSGPWYKNMPIVVRISPTVPYAPSPSLLSFSLHLSLSLFCPPAAPVLLFTSCLISPFIFHVPGCQRLWI